MKNPINQIVLEGPDLSGKSTLYNMIHKATDYRWNIQDRSSLSMLIHAKLYGRSEFQHVESLKNELNNLNNFMIILLPNWNVIGKRFSKRGDEIQNLSSLRKLYDLFYDAANAQLSRHPHRRNSKSNLFEDLRPRGWVCSPLRFLSLSHVSV